MHSYILLNYRDILKFKFVLKNLRREISWTNQIAWRYLEERLNAYWSIVTQFVVTCFHRSMCIKMATCKKDHHADSSSLIFSLCPKIYYSTQCIYQIYYYSIRMFQIYYLNGPFIINLLFMFPGYPFTLQIQCPLAPLGGGDKCFRPP